MRYTKHPGAIEALSMALTQVLRVSPREAVEAAIKVMDVCERHRVMVIPQALVGVPPGVDPLDLVADMAQSLEEEMGRKPWRPQ